MEGDTWKRGKKWYRLLKKNPNPPNQSQTLREDNDNDNTDSDEVGVSSEDNRVGHDNENSVNYGLGKETKGL